VGANEAGRQDETVRIDSAQLDDEVTKFISRELPPTASEAFDPYKTTVSTPQEKSAPPSQPSQPAPSEPVPSPIDPYKTTISTSSAPPPPPHSAASPPNEILPSPPTVTPTPPVSAPPAPVSPPAPSSATANIASAQMTNSAIPAETSPAVIISPPPPQTSAAAATPQAAPAPPKKRSKLPLIFGILFVLLLLGAGGAVAGYFFVVRPMLEKRRVAVLEEPRRPEPTPLVVTTPEIRDTKPESPKVEVPPYSPPADAVEFVNSNAKLTGKLAEHYVDFSFYYPNSWQKDPTAGTSNATNFVQVERRLPPNYTQENFAVGWYESGGSADADRTAFPRLAQSLSSKFEKSIDKYQKVSEGETKVGPYNAYEFRFEGQSQLTDKGQFKIWGVSVFVPPVDGSRNGVTLLMLATSLAPELKSVNDVGVKGELPMMLASFRFGK
jgi:hypothetical protein